jgi:hypothetical protein
MLCRPDRPGLAHAATIVKRLPSVDTLPDEHDSTRGADAPPQGPPGVAAQYPSGMASDAPVRRDDRAALPQAGWSCKYDRGRRDQLRGAAAGAALGRHVGIDGTYPREVPAANAVKSVRRRLRSVYPHE